MALLTPNAMNRKKPGDYPDPPDSNSSAVPAPTPPQFAPPPPPTQQYGVQGPPGGQQTTPSSPYQSTGIKGAPIPGQTVQKYGATGAPASPTPATPGSGIGGSDQDKINYFKQNIDSTISDDQWRAWLPHLDSGCPSQKPFRTERPGPGGSSFSGPEKCVEKPDNCPEGYQVVGNDRNGVAGCQPAGQGGMPGSPGGPGSSGGGRYGLSGQAGQAGGFNPSAGFGGLNDLLQSVIMGNLQNPVSRYTPEAMATLLSGTKQTAEDQSQQTRDAINEDAAARGVLGSGATGTALANARIAANRTVAGEQQNISRAKIDADFQDKQQAIQNAQQNLDQARDWAYKQQMTSMQREQFNANLALAYARMQQDWDQLQASYGYQSLLGGA